MTTALFAISIGCVAEDDEALTTLSRAIENQYQVAGKIASMKIRSSSFSKLSGGYSFTVEEKTGDVLTMRKGNAVKFMHERPSKFKTGEIIHLKGVSGKKETIMVIRTFKDKQTLWIYDSVWRKVNSKERSLCKKRFSWMLNVTNTKLM